MAGPWEKYQSQTTPAQAAPAGPWDKFKPTEQTPSPEPQASRPSAYDVAASLRETDKGGALKSEFLTDSELQHIAKLTGTDANKLKQFAPYFGAIPESEQGFGTAMKNIVAHAGKMAFGVPQKLVKMAQDDKYERALDILGSMAGQKQSYFLDIADIAGAPAALSGKAIKAFAPSAAPIAKTIGTIAEGVGTGALAGAAQAEKGKELEGATFGGAIGGAAASVPAIYRTVKGVTKWSNDKIKQGVQNIRDNGANIEEAYAAIKAARQPEIDALKQGARANLKTLNDFSNSVDDNTVKNLVSDDLRAKVKEGPERELLAGMFKGRDLASVPQQELDKALAYMKLKSLNKDLKRTFGAGVRELIETRKPQDVDNLIEELDKTNFALQAVSGKGFEKTLNPLEKIGYNLMRYVSDSKPFLQVLDDRYGTNFELIADDASKKMNLIYGAGVRRWAPEIAKISSMTKDPARYQQIISEIESGSPASAESKFISDFFSSVLEDANQNGANIKALKGGYFPKLRKGPVEYIRSYRQQADKLQKELNIDFSDMTDENYNKFIKDKNVKSFIDETLRVTDLNDNAEGFKQGFQILNGDIAKARSALNLKAFAAMKRSETELPDWAREIDPAKAAQRWVTNTYKFLALKDELSQLNAAEQIARKAKDNNAADYLKNLRQDWMGGRTDTLSSWGQKQGERWQIKMDAAANDALSKGNKSLANLYEGAKSLPDIFVKGQNNIYTNALGLSPKAAMQNLASFYTQNFPELGHATSIYYTGKALPKLGNLIRTGKLGEFVYSKGLIDKDWTGEAVDVLSGQLRKSFARKMSQKAAEKYSHAVMAAFKGSELTARAMTTLIAEDVAEDIFKSPELRNKIILNMKSSAYKRALQNALEGRDINQVKNILTSYLNSNNMYNYNKLNQAEFARSLGPMFSIFSKWPTMAVGSQMKDFMSGAGITPAVAKNMRLLYLPYATMYLADQVINQSVKPMIGEQRFEAVAGKKGLHGMMVTDATPTGVFERGGILASPAVRAAAAVANSIVSEDTYGQRFTKAFKDLSTTYIPVLPLAERVLTRDLPRILHDEKPK